MVNGVKIEKPFHYKSCVVTNSGSNKHEGLIALLHGYWCKKKTNKQKN